MSGISAFEVQPGVPLSVAGRGQQVRVTNTSSSLTLYGGGPAVAAATASSDWSIAAGGNRMVVGPAYVVSTSKCGVIVESQPIQDEVVDAWSEWWVGGPQKLNNGTSTTPTANRVYLGQVRIGQACLLTGIRFLIGATGGTDKAIVVLYDNNGQPLAYSDKTGTTVSTSDTYQSVPFTSKFYVASPGKYFLGVGYNGNTARIELNDSSAGDFGDSSVIGGTANSAFDFTNAPVKITVPTTYGNVPCIHTY